MESQYRSAAAAAQAYGAGAVKQEPALETQSQSPALDERRAAARIVFAASSRATLWTRKDPSKRHVTGVITANRGYLDFSVSKDIEVGTGDMVHLRFLTGGTVKGQVVHIRLQRDNAKLVVHYGTAPRSRRRLWRLLRRNRGGAV